MIFYFIKMFGDELRAFALVSLYAAPNEYLLQRTYNTLVVCRHQAAAGLTVIEASCILAVVAMPPFPFLINGQDSQYFVIEKAGLDVIEVDDLEDNE